MTKSRKDRTLAELEDNQAELRKNIEASNELIARSDALIGRFRHERSVETQPSDSEAHTKH
jgi:hypothetical protein